MKAIRKSAFRFRERAFTLVEMLVVIAIIAVLAAFIIPAITGAIAKGRQSACISNMRQIGAALILYTNENNGDFPETTHTTGAKISRAWIYTLKPYLGNIDKVRISPADPKGAARLKANASSYILNSYVFVPQVGPFGEMGESFNNIRRIPFPEHTILAFNISDQQSPSVMNDHTHSDLWPRNWKRLCADIQPDRHRTGSANKDNTKGSANYLYADGHVGIIEAAEVKRRLERGVLFAKPPVEREDIESL